MRRSVHPGAISAVLFAAIVYFPEMKLFIIPIPVPIPAPLFAVGYVAYSWWSARQARGRINHDAHLGGALFGVVFVMLSDPQPSRECCDPCSGDRRVARRSSLPAAVSTRAFQELRTVALFRAESGRQPPTRGGYTRAKHDDSRTLR